METKFQLEKTLNLNVWLKHKGKYLSLKLIKSKISDDFEYHLKKFISGACAMKQNMNKKDTLCS